MTKLDFSKVSSTRWIKLKADELQRENSELDRREALRRAWKLLNVDAPEASLLG